ncbi:MAG: pilin [Patescibacteria group bacterium]
MHLRLPRYLFFFALGVSVLLLALFFVSGNVFAESTGGTQSQGDYQLLTDIPGFKSASEAGNFTELINTIYKLSIALSIALAVIILVIEGVRYSASAIPGVKSDIKERIALVFGGLILLIGAYMFLALINPIQLVNFGDLGKNNILPSNVGVGVVTDGTMFEIEDPTDPDHGGIEVQPYVWQSDDELGNSNATRYETKEECERATGGSCSQITNTDYVSTYNAPPMNPGGGRRLFMSHTDPDYKTRLTREAISEARAASIRGSAGAGSELAYWPVNPYRTPEDFADCRHGVPTATKDVMISERTVENDAYINQVLFEAGIIDRALPITSAYRSNPRNQGPCITDGKGSNHPYYESVDMSLSQLDRGEKVLFLQLLLDLGVCRMGFGSSYMHVQWNGVYGADCAPSGNDSGSRTYWCYGGAKPYAPLPGWAGAC